MDPSQFVRDADYYLQDGDLVILVESTLFRVRRKPSSMHQVSQRAELNREKVHRFILSRDSSTFQNMFEVGTGTEGSTDDNPLQLYGDTVKAVRSLLSVLYAL
jgi:hypothetical protein